MTRQEKMNKEPCVLMVSCKDLVHTDLVCSVLKKRGVRFFRFNVDQFPQKARLSLDPATAEGSLILDNHILSLADVTSCWYYHSPVPKISSKIKTKQNREFAIGESRATINGMWRLLDDRFWINHPKYLFAGSLYKLKQLQVAREIGFVVPKSLVTNDPVTAKNLFDILGSKVILKMMGPPPDIRGMSHVFTSLVSKDDLNNNLEQIKLAPVLFQEQIPKKFELRITMVGKNIYPAALYTNDDPAANLDWKLGQLSKFRHERYELPKDIVNKCQIFMEKMGLNYGAIDLIVTPENKFVFLEVNPSGAWGWIEGKLGFPISESIADLLIAGNSGL
jgi:hypothetical protein